MTTSTKIGLSLEFFLDGQGVSEYLYKNNKVKSAAVDVNVSREDYIYALKQIDLWVADVERVSGKELTVGNISPGFLEEVKDEDEEVKFEFEVGDLTLKISYNKSEKTFHIERSSYDLNWTDFLQFVKRYKEFYEIYAETFN